MSNNETGVSLQHFFRSGDVQSRIESLLQDRAAQFTTSMMSAVNQNVALQKCEPWSVLTAGITAASMDLPIDPNLGYAYIIPYWDNKNRIQKAQFQLGAKGFKQLALRSGHYKLINVTDVRAGEYKGVDRLTGEYNFKWMKNEQKRREKDVIGYVAYFELMRGYKKALYMTVDDLMAHARKYSKQFQSGGGQWADIEGGGFDNMARKTVMKLLISKDGITSTDLQKALRADQSVVNDDEYDYVDNAKNKGDHFDQTNQNDDAGGDQTPKTDEDKS